MVMLCPPLQRSSSTTTTLLRVLLILSLLMFLCNRSVTASSRTTTTTSTTTTLTSPSCSEEETVTRWGRTRTNDGSSSSSSSLFGILPKKKCSTTSKVVVPRVLGQDNRLLQRLSLMVVTSEKIKISNNNAQEKKIWIASSTTTTTTDYDGNLKKNQHQKRCRPLQQPRRRQVQQHQHDTYHDIDTKDDDNNDEVDFLLRHLSSRSESHYPILTDCAYKKKEDASTSSTTILHRSSSSPSSTSSAGSNCTTPTTSSCGDNNETTTKHVQQSILHTLRGGDDNSSNWGGGGNDDDIRDMLDDLDDDALEMLFGRGDPDDHDDDDDKSEPSYFMSMVQSSEFISYEEINLENVAKNDFLRSKSKEFESLMKSGFDMIQNGTAESNATATSILIRQVKHIIRNDTALSDILSEEDEEGNPSWAVSRRLEGSDDDVCVTVRWYFDVYLEVRIRYLEACFHYCRDEYKKCIDICGDILKKYPFLAENYLAAQQARNSSPNDNAAAAVAIAIADDNKKGDTSSVAASTQVTASSTAYAFLGKNLTFAIVDLRDKARVESVRIKCQKAVEYQNKGNYAACIKLCKRILDDMIPRVRSQLMITREEKYTDPLVWLKQFKLDATTIMDHMRLIYANNCLFKKVADTFNSRQYGLCLAPCQEILSMKLSPLRPKRSMTSYLSKFRHPSPSEWNQYSYHETIHSKFEALQSKVRKIQDYAELRIQDRISLRKTRKTMYILLGVWLVLAILAQIFDWSLLPKPITVVNIDTL